MTSRRTTRYGTLLSVVLALVLTMALAACNEGDPGGEGTPGSLLERAAEREATQEAGSSATDPTPTPSLLERAAEREAAREGESSATGPTPYPTVELGLCSPRPANPPPAQTSAETDKDALVAIFDATDGDGWDESSTWGGRKPIGEWAGVTTDEDGRVVGLDVNLGGAEIPPELGHLTHLTTLTLSGVSGALPPELGYLANLTGLDLSDNRLCGKLPPELGSLASLQSLNLGGNQLSGDIPPELGGLGSLQVLNLAENQLSGSLPPELGSLASLQSLNLESNQLSGDILPELGGLGSLQVLNLAENQLSGSLPPELGGLGSLQVLNLAENQLSGSLPPELGSLASLQSLNLESNQLSGDIPLELDNLVSILREIRFDGNQLGCISNLLSDGVGYAGEIPVCIVEDHPGDTEALIALYNAWGQPGQLENWLSREPIGEWEGVSVDSNGRVAALNLAGKGLSREIPPEVGSLESLQVLDLSGNALTGELPELGSLESLKVLDLSSNPLTGQIPPELEELDNLVVNFRGTGLCKSSAEAVVGYANLCHEREIVFPLLLQFIQIEPDSVGWSTMDIENWRRGSRNVYYSFDDSGPRRFYLRTNDKGHVIELEIIHGGNPGEIPPELGDLGDLGDLGGLSISGGAYGEIPPELGNFSNLTYLYLGENNLTGEIPPELGNLVNLQELRLGGNELTGEIPPELGNLVNLQELRLGGNELTGEIPPELGNLVNLQELRLGGNELTGEIPPELGNLVNLTYLNLRGNVTGCVPASLQAIRQANDPSFDFGGLPDC